MEAFKFSNTMEEWVEWHHNPVTKEAKRYLQYLLEQQKEDWANGVMVGKTQEETGYLSSIGLAKVTVLDNIINDVFTNSEIGND